MVTIIIFIITEKPQNKSDKALNNFNKMCSKEKRESNNSQKSCHSI